MRSKKVYRVYVFVSSVHLHAKMVKKNTKKQTEHDHFVNQLASHLCDHRFHWGTPVINSIPVCGDSKCSGSTTRPLQLPLHGPDVSLQVLAPGVSCGFHIRACLVVSREGFLRVCPFSSPIVGFLDFFFCSSWFVRCCWCHPSTGCISNQQRAFLILL